MFEQIKCDIAINGDSRSVITKKPVSIPEVVVLRHIHGDDSVTNISVIGQWDHDDESDDLQARKNVWRCSYHRNFQSVWRVA